MAKKSSKAKSDKSSRLPSFAFFKDGRAKRIVGVLLILLTAFLIVSFVSYPFTWKQDQDKVFQNKESLSLLLDKSLEVENAAGSIGAWTAHQAVYRGFGVSSYLLLGCFLFWIINLFTKRKLGSNLKVFFYTTINALLLSPILAFFFNSGFRNRTYDFQFGGSFGNKIVDILKGFAGSTGTLFILIGAALILIISVFNPVFKLPLFDRFLGRDDENDAVVPSIQEETVTPTAELHIEEEYQPVSLPEVREPVIEEEVKEDPAEVIRRREEELARQKRVELQAEAPAKQTIESTDGHTLEVQKGIEEQTEEGKKIIAKDNYNPALDLSRYKFPHLDLLENRSSNNITIDKDELERNKIQIIQTLKSFKIEISKISATVGPTVTLYEIVPAEGVRISKIRNLEDDIALNLAALGIRIIAPIPGKGTIGIEVPNRKKQFVDIRTLLASKKFISSEFDLPIAIGKKIDNENFIVDLAKMPHLLMAGATGQGKSVGINTILVSLLYKKHPSQLKFVLVDPKKVELSIYNHIEKHFLAKLPNEEEAIITDTKKVVNTVNALCMEMDERYELLKNAKARNLKEYNAKFLKRKLNPENGHKFLPYIVLVIDEFADLIMTAGKEIEMPIARLAQLARAIGIHLIVATQRPSVNVITGSIKANFPARMAFKVSSKIDSRTILDTGGAEQLIGQGDLLVSTGNDLVRIQCAFVDTPEVEKVVEFIGNQRGYPTAFELPEYIGPEAEKAGGGGRPREFDTLFKDAAMMVVTSQSGSTSMLQRRFGVGYNRAGRIMDQMEAIGIVGPAMGGKKREVMVHTEGELLPILETLGL